MVGRRPDGRPDRHKVKAKSRKECLAKLLQLRQELAAGDLADPNRVTVEAFFTEWLEGTVRVRRRASTYRQYKSLLTAHLLPALGRKPLKAVQTKHLDDLYRALEREGRRPGYARKGAPADAQAGLAPKSIRGLHIAVHSGFERPVEVVEGGREVEVCWRVQGALTMRLYSHGTVVRRGWPSAGRAA